MPVHINIRKYTIAIETGIGIFHTVLWDADEIAYYQVSFRQSLYCFTSLQLRNLVQAQVFHSNTPPAMITGFEI